MSERTVEENILRKANQKRLLGDIAIEGGNFTTAFFKKQTIHVSSISTVQSAGHSRLFWILTDWKMIFLHLHLSEFDLGVGYFNMPGLKIAYFL